MPSGDWAPRFCGLSLLNSKLPALLLMMELTGKVKFQEA